MKRKTTWILIADGARVRILRYLGRLSGVQQLQGYEWQVSHVQDRELGTDRPGRVFDSVGKGRHSIEPHTSVARLNKDEFAHGITDFLQEKLEAGAFDRLVLIAPPETLGDLRGHLSDKLAKSIFAEVPLDLTHVPNDKIDGYLRQHVPTL